MVNMDIPIIGKMRSVYPGKTRKRKGGDTHGETEEIPVMKRSKEEISILNGRETPVVKLRGWRYPW